MLPHATTAEHIEATLSIEAALFSTGRPLMAVPRDWQGAVATRVAIGWDGSAEAARAVADAQPLLRLADSVVVIGVGDAMTGTAAPDAMVNALAWRGIAASATTAEAADGVGASLLAAANAADCDLLVMGGYGHSRLREMILGGATRGVLGAGTLPVLMSH